MKDAPKMAIDVSPEMVTFVGTGPFPIRKPLDSAVTFYFDGFREGAAPILGFRPDGSLDRLEERPLVFLVQKHACERIFGFVPGDAGRWHLTSRLRKLGLSVIECEAQGEARSTLRLARSIELLCQLHAALKARELLPVAGDGSLGELDIARIANARRILDQRWHEKLTIVELARLAGINRDKLVRGFRELYATTIAEMLSERRLTEARKLLLVTDLPVSTVAFRCSYLNNASFTRAFTRRYGLAPTELRRMGIAA